jgi:hypothetical protein
MRFRQTLAESQRLFVELTNGKCADIPLHSVRITKTLDLAACMYQMAREDHRLYWGTGQTTALTGRVGRTVYDRSMNLRSGMECRPPLGLTAPAAVASEGRNRAVHSREPRRYNEARDGIHVRVQPC